MSESTRNNLEVPPPLMTSDLGSFARRTIVERKPQIIHQVIEDNGYPPDIVEALAAQDPTWLINGKRGIVQLVAG